MLLLWFNSFATMAREMVVNNKNQRTLIKAKMKVSIEMKKHIRLNILKTTKDLGVLTTVEFKTKVKEVSNLSLQVPILAMIN
jgi:hypothetical protein